MKKIINTKKGYALLFTMVIVSVIMVIATGISSSISKQLVLSATAAESQRAFYEADTAAECALYASQSMGGLLNYATLGTIDCGGITAIVTNLGLNLYSITPPPGLLKDPCFKIDIDESKSLFTNNIARSYGYNICDTTNKNVVERGIEIEY